MSTHSHSYHAMIDSRNRHDNNNYLYINNNKHTSNNYNKWVHMQYINKHNNKCHIRLSKYAPKCHESMLNKLNNHRRPNTQFIAHYKYALI